MKLGPAQACHLLNITRRRYTYSWKKLDRPHKSEIKDTGASSKTMNCGKRPSCNWKYLCKGWDDTNLRKTEAETADPEGHPSYW